MTAAHIHRGEKGINGPVTIPLDVNAECVHPNPAEIKALIDWPDGYYVEIHTIVFQQNGAVRGQTVPESGGGPPPTSSTSTEPPAPAEDAWKAVIAGG